MNMKKLDKRVLISKANSQMFIAVIIASVVVSISLVTAKFLNDMRTFQDRVIAAEEEARDQLAENIDNVEELEAAFIELEAGEEVTSEEILAALPSKYDFPALTSSIEKLVDLGGVTLGSFSGSDDAANAIASDIQPAPEDIEFTIQVSGSYDEIQDFVDTLELSIRPFTIESVRFSGNDDSMSADIKITTYYQPSKSLEFKSETIQ